MKSTTSLILILISVGLFYTFISPQYDEIKLLSSEQSEYKTVLKDVAAIIQIRDNLLQDYRNIPQEDIDRLEKVIPDNIDVVRLAYDLDTIAAKYKIVLLEISTTADQNVDAIYLEETGEVFERGKVNFIILSNYENFKKFIFDVERSLRIIDVRELSFNSSKSGLYEHEVTAETYWLKQ
jgi:Tfp pilus assembly protein PilO